MNNPVLHSEFRYQRFVIQNSRSGGLWILLAILMVVPALVAAIAYIIGLSFGLIPPPSWTELPYTWHFNSSVVLLIVMISMTVVVTLVTYGLAHGSIRREKEKHTWQLLRLSHVDNGKIVFGKWWASLWALNGDNAMVIVLRLGVLAMLCATYLPAWQAAHGSVQPFRLYFLLLMPLILLQALFDAGLSAIIGLASAIPDETWGSVASSGAIVLRLLLSIGMGYWFYLIIMSMGSDFAATWLLAAQGMFGTLILLLLGLISAKLLLDYF